MECCIVEGCACLLVLLCCCASSSRHNADVPYAKAESDHGPASRLLSLALVVLSDGRVLCSTVSCGRVCTCQLETAHSRHACHACSDAKVSSAVSADAPQELTECCLVEGLFEWWAVALSAKREQVCLHTVGSRLPGW